MMIIAGMLFGLALTALIWPLLPERPRLSLATLPGAPGPETVSYTHLTLPTILLV